MDKQRTEGINKLDQKVSILEDWLATAIPYYLTASGKRVKDTKKGGFQLEFYPKSVSGLRGWNGDRNSSVTVAKYGIPTNTTAQTTYKAIPEAMKERIEGNDKLQSLFERLKNKENLQRDNGRVSNIQELEAKLVIAIQNHKVIAHELIALRLENDTLSEDLRVKGQQMHGLKQQHKTEIEWRDKLTKQHRLQIAELKEQKQQLHQQLLEICEKTNHYIELQIPQTNIIELKRED